MNDIAPPVFTPTVAEGILIMFTFGAVWFALGYLVRKVTHG